MHVNDYVNDFEYISILICHTLKCTGETLQLSVFLERYIYC